MGSGVRVVDLSLYHPTRDTQRTFRLSGPRAQVPSLACAQQQKQALLVHSVQVVGDLVTLATAFLMTVIGFVEVVSRAFLREQIISELFLKKGVLTERHSVYGVTLKSAGSGAVHQPFSQVKYRLP